MLILLFLERPYKLSKKNREYVLFFIGFLSIYMFLFIIINILHFKFPTYYFFDMLFDPVLLVIYFCSTSDKFSINISLFYKFENIVIILASISLIFWLLLTLNIHIISPNMHFIISWGKTSIVNGYFGVFFMSQGLRNTGIFAESPMYAYVLCISLFIELFMKKNSRIFTWRSIIILLTILSTTSTTGIMIALPTLVYKEFISSKNKLKKVLCVSLIPIALFILYFVLNHKIGNVTNLGSSYNIRMNDLSSAINAWKQHLWIGNGLGNMDSIRQYMYYWRLLPGGNAGVSTGLFEVLAYGGILFAIFYIIPTLLSFKCSSDVIGIAVLSFILLIYTVIPNVYLYIMVLSYLISCYIKCSSNRSRILIYENN